MNTQDIDFIWQVIRDMERALNRFGLYPEKDPGGVCHEIRIAHKRMADGDILKAKQMLKMMAPPEL